MAKLSIVVICSDRKSEVPAPGLQARHLPEGRLDTRSAIWLSHLRKAAGTRALTELYRGEGWFVLPQVLAAARRAGFDPDLLVASAGLGLRSAESVAAGYAATLVGGQPDTVGATSADRRGWWHRLRAAPGALDPQVALRGRVLLVLSSAYATAMHSDLVALGGRGDDVLMIGGAVDVDGIRRLPADRSLRTALGGTATGLTMRMARAWLDSLDGVCLTSPVRLQHWQAWAASVRREESWARQPLTDEQVLQFVREARSADPTLSRTRALRELRDSGRACEQSRFAELYRRVALR